MYLLIPFLLNGCTTSLHGDGNIVEERLAVTPFTAISSEGINIMVEPGEGWDITLEGDQNLLPAVLFHQEGEEVFIYVDPAVSIFPTQMTVVVTAPALSHITHTDGADLFVDGLDQDTLEIVADGTGSTELIGAVDVLDLYTSGSGIRNAQDLWAGTVSVTSAGTGDVWLMASESITGSLSGSGNINVYGKPVERSLEDNGAGSIAYY